ncbi:Sphingomyelin phosphodiesterase [Dirofilaria immitis]
MLFLQTTNSFILFNAIAITFFVNSLLIYGIPAMKDYDDTSNSNGAICAACEISVVFFRSVIYEQNGTRNSLIHIATFICQYFVHGESLICQGLAKQFREEILYVVDKLILQPDTLCSMFITGCKNSRPDTSSWNIMLPPKLPDTKYPTHPTIRQDNLRVLHITDLHLDPEYAPGSEANCSSKLCCHMQPELYGSAITQKSGYWGSLAVCDIPYWTIENMLQNIQKLGKIDYILVGGDYESHMDWAYTKEDHLKTIRNISSLLHKYFANIPIYWTLGNHEGVPINSFPPHYIPEKYRLQWLYDELSQLQKPFIDMKSIENIKYSGSYTVQLHPGLRLISLNNGYCETSNFWLYINETDPDGTLSWLVAELKQAESDGQYVHILSHIPPGNEECRESWARNYYKIIARFSKTIKAQFFGHVHIDSFTVFYENMNDDSSKPISVLYASPSVTTFTYLNPAFRIYEIESGMNYRVVDFHTYFLNLTQIGMSVTPPVWELLYSAKKEYSLVDLSPTSWDRLINKIIYEKTTYNRFIRNSNRQDNFICEGKCRYNSLCSLRKGHHNTTLCSHLSSYSNVKRNSYKSSRIVNHVEETMNVVNPVTVTKQQQYVEIMMLLKKKLRSHIMKRFLQLFLFP